MQELTIRCLTVTHLKLIFLFSWGSGASLFRRSQTWRKNNRRDTIRSADLQQSCQLDICKDGACLKKKKKKIVPFPLGAIYQILCQLHDDIQHQARPLSLFQDMWTKSFEKKLRSPSVQSCFAANCLPRSQSIFQPKQAVFLCCSRCSDVSNSAMPLFIKGTHDAFKLV